MNVHVRIIGGALFGFCVATLGIGQTSPTSNPAQAPSQPGTQNPWDALSRTGENHKLLAQLVGTWSFTAKHPDPNGPFPTFTGTVVRRAIWEERYFLVETTGGKRPMPWADGREVVYQDMMTEGYDNLKKKYFRTFINNHFDTGVTLYEGTYDPATTSFTYIGNADSPYGGKDTLHLRVTILDLDHYREELSTKGDNGWDSGVTVINYTRLKQN